MKLDDISVSRKLWASTGLILLAMLTTALLVQRYIERLQDEATARVAAHESLITDATRWRGMTETNTQRVIATTVTPDPAITAAFADKLKAGIAEISVLQKKIADRATTPADAAALARVGERRTVVLAMLKKGAELRDGGDPATIRRFVDGEFAQAIDAYLGALDEFVKLQASQRDAALAAAEAAQRRASWLGAGAMLAVGVLSLLWITALVRSIREPLAQAVRTAQAIAGGDLTVRVDGGRRDEIGQLLGALSGMTERLRTLVAEVRRGVESVNTASGEIATGNHDLSARTEQTASNLQQTASSMEQITTTVGHAADTAREATQLAGRAADAASRGGDVVAQVVDSMQAISASSKKIADIIGTIDAIAFQTNILALNAAVESARAGEAGKGFAVVASEVRTLAQRSGEASRSINALIVSSNSEIAQGVTLVRSAGAALEKIVGASKEVAANVSGISVGSSEQANGVDELSQILAVMDGATQHNAALAEQSAASIAALSNQIARLDALIATFKVV